MSSFSAFKKLVDRKGVAVLTVDLQTWETLFETRSAKKLTRAFDRNDIPRISANMVCVIETRDRDSTKQFLSVITRRDTVATGQSRLSFEGLHETFLKLDLKPIHQLATLSKQDFKVLPVTGKRANDILSAIENDAEARAAARYLTKFIRERDPYRDIRSLEKNAVSLSLKLFGVPKTVDPVHTTIRDAQQTVLEDFAPPGPPRLLEDNVIAHDARWIDGFDLVASEAVGRAMFRKGRQQLEVITANRTPLEKLLGVDLIYINRTLESVVLVQYKMMEKVKADGPTDWAFRPDAHFRKQIGLLNRVERPNETPGDDEYRLNPRLSYLKFVKREAPDSSGSCILPLQHFEMLERSGQLLGERGGTRLLRSTIKESSLTETAFIGLVSTGYIGCYRKYALDLKEAFEGLLVGGDRLVVAIETELDKLQTD